MKCLLHSFVVAMKAKSILFLMLLFSVGVIIAVMQLSRGGLGDLMISDVTQPIQKTVKAPIVPFRNGALFVVVNGQLDGNATLKITSNHGRDHRTEVLSGIILNKTIGGAEEWVDDLVVRFEPGSAKKGQVRIQMACGKNLKGK